MTRKEYHEHVVSDTGPFSIVPEWLLVSTVSHGAVRLYALIARYADYSTGEAFPSRLTLASKLRVSKDSIDRFVRELVDIGALDVVRRRNGTVWQSNLYVVRRSQGNPQGGIKPAGTGRNSAARGSRNGTARGSRTGTALTRTTQQEQLEQEFVTSDVAQVFEAWVESTGRRKAVTRLDASRVEVIVKALVAYPLEDVLDAVRGWSKSPWHAGHNDEGKVYNNLATLIGTAERIEQFRDFYRMRNTPTSKSSETLRLLDDIQRRSQ